MYAKRVAEAVEMAKARAGAIMDAAAGRDAGAPAARKPIVRELATAEAGGAASSRKAK